MSEVAARAGVSVPTVSRALAGAPGVAPETRRKVLAAAEELSYQPDDLARALRGGRTDDVAVVVPFVTNASAVERLRGLVDGLRLTPYNLTLFDVERPQDVTRRFDNVLRRRPSAIIAVSLVPSDSQLSAMADDGMPLIVVEGQAAGPQVATVNVDDVDAGRTAADHLLRLGHSRVAYLGDAEEGGFGFVASRERREGFTERFAEAGHPVEEHHVRRVEHGREQATEAALELLLGQRPPTAVFAASDTQALGVIDAAKRQGIRVPDDLSVVGCDDVMASADLGLTTVSVSLYESGLTASRLMSAMPSRDDADIVLPVGIRVRTTTGPAAV